MTVSGRCHAINARLAGRFRVDQHQNAVKHDLQSLRRLRFRFVPSAPGETVRRVARGRQLRSDNACTTTRLSDPPLPQYDKEDRIKRRPQWPFLHTFREISRFETARPHTLRLPDYQRLSQDSEPVKYEILSQ